MGNVRDANIQIKRIHNYKICYLTLPYKRNQDVVVISSKKAKKPWISIVDGWTNPEFIKGDTLGREVAYFTARQYPRFLQKSPVSDMKKKASPAAHAFDHEFLSKYPWHIVSVGAFLFPEKKVTVITVGSVDVFYWDKNHWVKPKEQGDYTLPYPEYPSDCSRFFGRGELKSNPIYSCEPDVIKLSKNIPLFIATDGLLKAMPLDRFQRYSRSNCNLIWSNPKKFIYDLQKELRANYTQIDDITLLLVTPKK